jgi:hypothetical protein
MCHLVAYTFLFDIFLYSPSLPYRSPRHLM